MYRSRLGNNQYILLPYRKLNVNLCKHLNTDFKQYVAKSIKPPATDFPYSDDPNADLCELFRSNKTVSIITFRKVLH